MRVVVQALAKRFGEIVDYPLVKGLDDYPQIIPVVKLEHEKHNFGGLWHSDTTYLDIPPLGSILVARELPPYGGDTEFANMYLAYDTLSEGMKNLLDPLKGVSVSNLPKVRQTRQARMDDSARAQPEGRRQVDGEDPVPFIFRHFKKRTYGPYPGIVHQHIDRTELIKRFTGNPGTIP